MAWPNLAESFLWRRHLLHAGACNFSRGTSNPMQASTSEGSHDKYPWGSRFEDLTVGDTHNIQGMGPILESNGNTLEVQLTALDQSPFLLFVSFTHFVVLESFLSEEVLIKGCQQVADRWPVLCGRYDYSKPKLSILCTNQGFPLTVANWLSGSTESVPSVLTFDDWHVCLPSDIPTPGIVHPIQGTEAVFKTGPLFSIRMTKLGQDGGCILALTCNHGLCDSAQLVRVTEVLAQTCRGKHVPSLKHGLSRNAMLPSNLAISTPDLSPLVENTTKLLSMEAEKEALKSFKESWLSIFPDTEYPIFAASLDKETQQQISSLQLVLDASDLSHLQQTLYEQHAVNISRNDIMLGVVWCMRAIVYGFPLPGQEGSEHGFGSSSICLKKNVFKNGLDEYFGNTVDGLQIKLSVSEIKTNRPETRLASVEEIQEAVLVAAIAHRRALDSARKGDINEALFYRLLVPNQLVKTCEAISNLKAAGQLWRFGYSNLTSFENKDCLKKLDFGTGPSLQVATTVSRAGSFARLNTGPEGAYLHMYLPSIARQVITEKFITRGLLPNSYWLSYTTR